MDAPAFDLPVLRTSRLTLRPFTSADAPRVQQLAGDWQVARSTAAVPHPYEDGMAEAWIATHAGRWRSDGHATWAVCLPDGLLAGCIGLIVDLRHERGELGYWMGVEFWGRGYCTEAGRAVVAFGFDVLRLARIGAAHYADNPASGRVMVKLGMTREGARRAYHLRRGQRLDVVQYGILPEDPRR